MFLFPKVWCQLDVFAITDSTNSSSFLFYRKTLLPFSIGRNLPNLAKVWREVDFFAITKRVISTLFTRSLTWKWREFNFFFFFFFFFYQRKFKVLLLAKVWLEVDLFAITDSANLTSFLFYRKTFLPFSIGRILPKVGISLFLFFFLPKVWLESDVFAIIESANLTFLTKGHFCD